MKSSKKYMIILRQFSVDYSATMQQPSHISHFNLVVNCLFFVSALQQQSVDGFFSEFFSVSISPFNCSHSAVLSCHAIRQWGGNSVRKWEVQEDFATQLLLLRWWSKAAKKGVKDKAEHIGGATFDPSTLHDLFHAKMSSTKTEIKTDCW